MSIPPEKVRDVSDETTAQPDRSTSQHTFTSVEVFLHRYLFWLCLMTKGRIPKVHYRTIKSKIALSLHF